MLLQNKVFKYYRVYDYLSRKIVETEYKSPVEVSLSSQRVKVDVSLLFVSLQSLYPAVQRQIKHKYKEACLSLSLCLFVSLFI